LIKYTIAQNVSKKNTFKSSVEKSIIPNPHIEQGDKQDCVIEDGVFHDKLSKNSMAFIDHIPGEF
jgi:hypothetical protein